MKGLRWRTMAALGVVVLTMAPGLGSEVARADPGYAGDGVRSLSASNATGLNPNGDYVTVSGSGYDESQGIYVAFCRLNPGSTPGPCGGGADITGASGSSAWISSNPDYPNLTTPWGPGGSFVVGMSVSPLIPGGVDCRVVSCGIVTRGDHIAGAGSQLLQIPATFAQPVVPTAVPPTQPPAAAATSTPVPPAVATATTAASATPTQVTPTATPTSAPAPETSLSDDGRTGSSDGRSLEVSKVRDLSPDGAAIEVKGNGYDTAKGVYVALCAVKPGGAAPGPCTAGSQDAAAWISSNPPDYAKDLAKPYGDGGSFDVRLTVKPVIDSSTDCREVDCAIVTRADDTAPGDRSQEVIVPVSFEDDDGENNATATREATATNDNGDDTAGSGGGSGDGDGDGNGGLPWIIATAVGLVAIGAIGFGVWRTRRNGVATMALALLLLTGCSTAKSDQPNEPPGDHGADVGIVTVDRASVPDLPVVFTDANGREVEVTDASRIVPLWGNLTEIVYGLGLGDRVVGRDVTATFKDADDLPIVTRAHEVSAESVLSLNPTLVLASEDTGPETALTHIRNVGVPVVVFKEPASIDEIVPRIRAVAEALGVPEAGEALIAKTEAEFVEARATIPDEAEPLRVAFLYMRGGAGVYLIGGPGAGTDSMIEAAGAVDAGTAIGLSQAFTPITSEALVTAAPDVILMTTTGLESVGGIEGLVQIPGIAQTPAGQARRIVTLEDGLLFSFGPRTPEALRLLVDQLYGEGATTP